MAAGVRRSKSRYAPHCESTDLDVWTKFWRVDAGVCFFLKKKKKKKRGVSNKEHILPIIKGHTSICQELACHKESPTLCLLHTHHLRCTKPASPVQLQESKTINMWTEPNLLEIQHSMNPVIKQQASVNTLPLYKNNQRTGKHLYASYLFIKISFGHICSLHLI